VDKFPRFFRLPGFPRSMRWRWAVCKPARNPGTEIYCPNSIPFTRAILSVILSARDSLLVKFFAAFLVRKTQFPLGGIADHVFSRASSTQKKIYQKKSWLNFLF
jgi:hypothetical protein